MKTEIKLGRLTQQLLLTHTTQDGYKGYLVIPTDPFSNWAHEEVISPRGELVHEGHFQVDNLGDSDTDLEPYLVSMTESARRRYRRVS